MSTFAVLRTPGSRAVMGILNVTPDSFSDGGDFFEPGRARAHAQELVDAGADLIDVGGESTRPGADPVAVDEELRRIGGLIGSVAGLGVPVSIDTMKSEVAELALREGATVVNDVSAGRHDPALLRVAATGRAGLVLMHMQGNPRTMQIDPHYDDVVTEVGDFLLRRIEAAVHVGVDPERIVVDPGLGFGKTLEHNLMLLRELPTLATRVEVPVLVGASRKGFLGRIVDHTAPAAEGRDDATTATTVWAFTHGATMVRVHDVARARLAADLIATIEAAAPGGMAA